MTRLLPTLILCLLAACPPPGGGGAADLPAPGDLTAAADLLAPGDLLGAGECALPADCAVLDKPASVRFCPGSSWSCIAGRCTWECNGGRTCVLRPGSCLACDGKAPECVGDKCRGLIREMTPNIDEALCARGYLMEVNQCFGGFVRLMDGTVCTLEDLATGAVRELLACGRCQTAIVY